MWGEALSMLDRAERLHRQFFAPPAYGAARSVPSWQPPIDIVEADGTLRVHVALPGVAADSIALTLDEGGVIVSALRPFPCRDAFARVHRVEIPHGRFERRIALDLSGLELRDQALADGVLTLMFSRKEST
jgi:HSP20 family protein